MSRMKYYKYRLNPEEEKQKDFLLNITKYFSNAENSIHKARNELKIIPNYGIETVVKSFKVPNIINQIVYSFFRDSKAKNSYEYSLKIAQFTPKPIGYIEFYSNYLFKNSYFISEKFDYDFTIREPLLDENFPDKENIFKLFAQFTLELHNANILHNDYSPGNILIKKEGDSYIFKIVDINRMEFKELNPIQRAENFSKLWASDVILQVIVTEYVKNYHTDMKFIEKVLYYSNKHKKIKNLKKRLKGKKINV